MWRTWILPGLLSLLANGCSRSGTSDDIPEFRAKFAAAGLDNDFGEFIDTHAGEEVRLDIQWERGAFNGGAENASQFFVLFESCEEKLENGEKPGIGNCSGTKYTVPKSGGKTLITESGGKWRLRGVYTPGDRTGPSQGLSDVELEPAPERVE